MRRDISRRTVIAGSAGTLTAAIALNGCDAFSTDPAGASKNDGNGKGNGKGNGAASDAKEAPMLAKQVKNGKLPKLEQRLPESPMIVKPVDRPGTYGGTWHTAMLGPGDTSWLKRTTGYDLMMRWTPDWKPKPEPNIVESVEVEGDGKAYTFHLRKGMKWSDGEPFTADDIVFSANDSQLNTDLHPSPPTWLVAGGKPAHVEASDDYTVRFEFAQPNGLFLQHLATPRTRFLSPKHYMKKFHKKYNPEAAKLAKRANFNAWMDLFNDRNDEAANPDRPSLRAWTFTTALGAGSRMVAKRNPYYWKTDEDGRQLPYIDEVSFDVIDDDQVILLKLSHGDLDMHCRHVNTLHNKPVIARGRKKGNYQFFDLLPAIMNEMMIALNITHEDKAMRQVFQDKEFRRALSLAINRPELIKTVTQGADKVWQGAPRKDSQFFDKEFASQYTEYDVDKANSILDERGYAKGPSGLRQRPDGKEIRFSVEVPTPTLKDFWPDAMQLVKRYWKEVGVDMRVKTEDRTLFYERKEANKHDAGVWQGDGGLQDAILDPRWYMPFNDESVYATPWAAWFTSGGSDGEEPNAAAKKEMDLYHQIQATADQEKQAAIFEKLLQVAKEQFWVIGTMLPTQGYGVVKDNFHNVPKSMPDAYLYPTPGPSNPEQYFID